MKIVATNKKAFQNFHLFQTWECGIVLNGAEVKSIRNQGINFKDSFAHLEEGEIYLYNLHIPPYAQASYQNENPDRERKLLLHRKEIQKIIGQVSQKNYTLVPTKIYFNSRGLVKVEIALAKGKKLYDKREDIKKREIERGLKRMMRQKRQ